MGWVHRSTTRRPPKGFHRTTSCCAVRRCQAIEKASILRTVALLETLQGLVESAALQVLFVQTWELGGSSFIASWSVGHYLKRPQGVKEKAQTDGPPPTPSEAGPAAPTDEGKEEKPQGTEEKPEAGTAATDEAPEAPLPPPTGTMENFWPSSASRTRAGPGFVVFIVAPNDDVPLSGADFSAIRAAAVQSDATVVSASRTRAGPGFVVFIVAPNDDVPLSGADFSAIRAAAVQSDATVVLLAGVSFVETRFLERSPSSFVLEEGKKVAESNRALRPLADFAVRRFSPAGSSKAGSHQTAFQHLFEDDLGGSRWNEWCRMPFTPKRAIVSGKEAVYRSVVEGLQNLGFPGDAAASAEALLPVGTPKVSKKEFCDSLADAFVHPEMVGVVEWPEVRTVRFPGNDLIGEAALKTKVAEAWKAAGTGGHGVILVLAARGRSTMPFATWLQNCLPRV
eukprot:g12039.t2